MRRSPLFPAAPAYNRAASFTGRPAVLNIALLRRLLPYVVDLGTPTFRRWVVDRLPYKPAQELKSIVDIMHERSIAIYRAKKAALEAGDDSVAQQIGEGRDIMSILREPLDPSCFVLGTTSGRLTLGWFGS